MKTDAIPKPEQINTVHAIPQSNATVTCHVTAEFRDRIVRPAEAIIITGKSLSTIWRDEKAGIFPKRIRLGENAVGYKLSELLAWLESREIVTSGNVKVVALTARRGRKPKTLKEGK